MTSAPDWRRRAPRAGAWLTASIRTASATLSKTTSSTAFAQASASATCCTPP